MSNKKRKTKEQKIKYQQGKLLKVKELEKLRIEVIDLKQKIKEQKKIRKIRNLKVFRCTLNRIIVPIVLVCGISMGAGSFVRIGLPFKRDKIAKVKEININYETDKTTIINENYVQRNPIFGPKNKINELKIYFPYEENKNNQYEQVIRTYKLTNEDKRNIYEAILKSDLKNVIKDLDNYKEKINIIEEITETNNGYIVKCCLNFLDSNDKLYVEESNEEKILMDVLYINLSQNN